MNIRTPLDLGAAIRDRRRRRGWSQQELAENVGASRQWVNEVEKGKARTEIGLALRALDALGVTLLRDRGTERAVACRRAEDREAGAVPCRGGMTVTCAGQAADGFGSASRAGPIAPRNRK